MGPGKRSDGTAVGQERILKVRALFGELAGDAADPESARRVEAEPNGAWLRLQFAP